jgi:EAL domain-containing protein (putative c-di-GMP-specific phosphodiesterase class I)
MLMVNSPYTLETLQAIRDLGVGIAIDDFGTGFSSFAYILQYHVDRIKIDQSFIARSIQDPNATAVVRTIIAMAHGLNMRVVAEGVETHDQSDFLMRRRCDDAQGYLYARPVPKNDVFTTVQRIESELRQRLPAETLPLSEFDVPLETPVFLRN